MKGARLGSQGVSSEPTPTQITYVRRCRTKSASVTAYPLGLIFLTDLAKYALPTAHFMTKTEGGIRKSKRENDAEEYMKSS